MILHLLFGYKDSIFFDKHKKLSKNLAFYSIYANFAPNFTIT